MPQGFVELSIFFIFGNGCLVPKLSSQLKGEESSQCWDFGIFSNTAMLKHTLKYLATLFIGILCRKGDNALTILHGFFSINW